MNFHFKTSLCEIVDWGKRCIRGLRGNALLTTSGGSLVRYIFLRAKNSILEESTLKGGFLLCMEFNA